MGSKGGSNMGSRRGSNMGSRRGSNTGSRIGNNMGSRRGSNTGSKRGSNTGSRRGSNMGSRRGSNMGSRRGSNTGSRRGSNNSCMKWVMYGTHHASCDGQYVHLSTDNYIFLKTDHSYIHINSYPISIILWNCARKNKQQLETCQYSIFNFVGPCKTRNGRK